VFTRYDLRVTP